MGDLDVIGEDKSGSEIARWTVSGPVDSGWNQGFVSLPVKAEMVGIHELKDENAVWKKINTISYCKQKLFHRSYSSYPTLSSHQA